jgi:stage II sporulation protein D
MQKELEPWFREKGQKSGALQTVSLVKSNAPDGTLPEFDVRAGRQMVRISGSELRQLLSGHGIYSPRFAIAERGQMFEIKGRGHGHGVGLCQWGARGQALEGRTCEQILGYYYPGATLATRAWK